MRNGAELRLLRKTKKLTQEGLANLVGVSRNTVYDWERDAYSPEGENLIKLAKALNVSASYLMGETDDPREHKWGQTENTNGVRPTHLTKRLTCPPPDAPDGHYRAVSGTQPEQTVSQAICRNTNGVKKNIHTAEGFCR